MAPSRQAASGLSRHMSRLFTLNSQPAAPIHRHAATLAADPMVPIHARDSCGLVSRSHPQHLTLLGHSSAPPARSAASRLISPSASLSRASLDTRCSSFGQDVSLYLRGMHSIGHPVNPHLMSSVMHQQQAGHDRNLLRAFCSNAGRRGGSNSSRVVVPPSVAEQIGRRARQRQVQRMWTLVAGGSAAAGLVLFALNSLQENLMFYITPTQAAEKFTPEAASKRMRLGGLVLEGR